MDLDATSLKEIERRQWRYWNVDGVPELIASLGWLLWGVLYLIGAVMFVGRSYLAYSSAVWLTLFLWGFGVKWGIEKLKERITYPRVGYVQAKLRQAGIADYIPLVLFAGIQFAEAFGHRLDLHGVGTILLGGVVALAIALPAVRPWAANVAWIFLISLGGHLWRLQVSTDYSGMYWTLVCMGLIGIVFGVLRLRRFLRENPKVVETEA
jgi:hypothetical protein